MAERSMMRKKIFLVVWGISFILLFVLSCREEAKDRLSLLFYQEKKEGFYPYFTEWFYSEGEISTGDSPVKIGMLPLNYQSDLLYEDQWFSGYPTRNTGKDVYIRKGERQHEFHVQTGSSSDILDLSLAPPDGISSEEWNRAELLKACYDAEGKELILALDIEPVEEGKKTILLMARMGIKAPDKVSWKVFRLDREEYFDPQLKAQVIMTEKWLYGTSGEQPEKYPIRISLEKGTVEKLEELDSTIRNLVLDTGKEDRLISPRAVLPVGRCGEMVIWQWTIVTREDTESLFGLFRDETMAGALHIQRDGTWKVYDSRGNVSRVDMARVYQNEVYFPQ